MLAVASGNFRLAVMAEVSPHLFALISAIIRAAGNCNGLTSKDL